MNRPPPRADFTITQGLKAKNNVQERKEVKKGIEGDENRKATTPSLHNVRKERRLIANIIYAATEW